MAAKIIAFLLTAVVNALFGYFTFIILLLALNGFIDPKAEYGVYAYILLAIAVTMSMGGLAALGVHLLQKRGFRGWSAVLIAFPALSVIGVVLKVVSAIIGFLIADILSTQT